MYSVASCPEPLGRSTRTPSGSWSPVRYAKSLPGRNGWSVSLARTFSVPVGMTSVSPGKAAESAARRLAWCGTSGRGPTGRLVSRQPRRMKDRNASGKSGSCDSVPSAGLPSVRPSAMSAPSASSLVQTVPRRRPGGVPAVPADRSAQATRAAWKWDSGRVPRGEGQVVRCRATGLRRVER